MEIFWMGLGIMFILIGVGFFFYALGRAMDGKSLWK